MFRIFSSCAVSTLVWHQKSGAFGSTFFAAVRTSTIGISDIIVLSTIDFGSAANLGINFAFADIADIDGIAHGAAFIAGREAIRPVCTVFIYDGTCLCVTARDGVNIITIREIIVCTVAEDVAVATVGAIVSCT